MKFELLEVAGTHIFSMKAMTLVLFFIFAIIVVGYLVGKISIKGVSLGSAAIFLVALFAGHFKGVAFQDIASWQESLPAVDHYFKLVQNLGLVLFVTSVGLIAGPSFFKNLKKNAKSYVALGGIIIITGCLVCAAITLLVPNINSSMSVGLFAGALTSTPAFAQHKKPLAKQVRSMAMLPLVMRLRTRSGLSALYCSFRLSRKSCMRTWMKNGQSWFRFSRMMQLAASRKSCLKWISSASQHFS